MLLGRRPERAVLDGLLDAVRAGESRALVVRGDPGIGKSALLDYLAMRARDCKVIYAAGVQSEMELAFAYLHQACTPSADRFDALPEPQRDALTIALGMRVGSAAGPVPGRPRRAQPALRGGDRAAAGLGRRRRALGGPGLAPGDRVRGPPAAARVRRRWCSPPAPPGPAELAGLPTLDVTGLADEDARALLRTVLLGPVDEPVRDRMVAEARGNPLALLELRPAPGDPGESAAAGPDRAALPPPARHARRVDAAARAGRGGGPDRRPRAALAGRREAGHPRQRGRSRGRRRPDRDRVPGPLLAPVGALGDLPRRSGRRPAPGARRAGRGHRPGVGPGPPGLALPARPWRAPTTASPTGSNGPPARPRPAAGWSPRPASCAARPS